jgi:hypothetical protein
MDVHYDLLGGGMGGIAPRDVMNTHSDFLVFF